MQQASSDSRDGEPCATSEPRHSQPFDDASGADHSHVGALQLYSDFDQQYIMLDGGVFVRVNDKPALAAQQQSPSSPDRMSSSTFSKNSVSDTAQAILPQLLIVPQHNMAVNSISCAFSVGGQSFLVSPTCVVSESSMLSILDGNVDLSNDRDGALMLWCSWCATLLSQHAHSLRVIFFGSFLNVACIYPFAAGACAALLRSKTHRPLLVSAALLVDVPLVAKLPYRCPFPHSPHIIL